ncbi:hypothetical protein KAH81_00355, partial [bacterium]|nr:hypothetical protein [bacterium]
PPIYPILLAIFSCPFRVDPLYVTSLLNALLFAIIIILGGMMLYRSVGDNRIISIFGIVYLITAIPLIKISFMAWSEPLFVVFVLFFLNLCDKFRLKRNNKTVLLLALFSALASMTRYIGIVLVPCGIAIILVFSKDAWLKRIWKCAMFSVLSSLPLFIWVIRNYSISGTPFGPRMPSVYSLTQNCEYFINTFLSWHLSTSFLVSTPPLFLISIFLGCIIGFGIRDKSRDFKNAILQSSPLILFLIFYSFMLILSSTTTAYDKINTRLMSPIFIPLFILTLKLFYSSAKSILKKARLGKYSNHIVVLALFLWILYFSGIDSTILYIDRAFNEGLGYSHNSWKNSELIAETQKIVLLNPELNIYSNSPEALYIIGGIDAKQSLLREEKNSENRFLNEPSILIWFGKANRNYLLSPNELDKMTDFCLLSQLSDGDIYSIAN